MLGEKVKQNNIIKIYLTIVILLVLISCKIEINDDNIKIGNDELKYERVVNLHAIESTELFDADIDFGEINSALTQS